MVEFLVTNEYAVKDPVFLFPDNAGIDGFIPSNTPAFVGALLSKNLNLVFTKVDNNVDLFNKREDSYFDTSTGTFYLAPHSDILIPSGLYVKIPSDSALIDFNKSGIATKKKLDVGACIIDFSYQGIVHYHVFNFSNNYTMFKCDEKIVQMVEVKIGSGAKVTRNITPEEFYNGVKTSRADGGFGSTGLK